MDRQTLIYRCEDTSKNMAKLKGYILEELISLFIVQLNLGISDVIGPTNVICYWWIFVIANIGNKEK